jgi:hypothetical protein
MSFSMHQKQPPANTAVWVLVEGVAARAALGARRTAIRISRRRIVERLQGCASRYVSAGSKVTPTPRIMRHLGRDQWTSCI